MPDTLDISKMNDHELLLVLHTKFDIALQELQELKSGTTSEIAVIKQKLEILEREKASRVDHDALERRMSRLETRYAMFVGGLVVLQIAITAALKFFFH